MRVIYFAHPVSGDVAGNLKKARAWIRFLEATNPDVAIVANWITECEIWDDDVPEQRAASLARDLAVISKCDELWYGGVERGELTRGMELEYEHAAKLGKPVTWCGGGVAPDARDLSSD